MDSRQFTRIYIYPTLEKLIQQFNQFSICDYYFQNYFVTTNMKQNTYWNEKKCQIRTRYFLEATWKTFIEILLTLPACGTVLTTFR